MICRMPGFIGVSIRFYMRRGWIPADVSIPGQSAMRFRMMEAALKVACMAIGTVMRPEAM